VRRGRNLVVFVLANFIGYSTAADSPAVVEALQMERADALPRTAFYDVTAAEIHGEPGTLIRSEPADADRFAVTGVHVRRILYRSRSQFGHETAASAVVIVPDRKPPAGGWPTLIWAHGTMGVARQCAPSLTRQIGYYTTTLVQQGLEHDFAVVAVDYSGLGAGDRHEYLWKVANANDVAYAAPAARAAQPDLAPVWVAIGHSQGGQAVWGLAEKMVDLKDDTYRGSLALAPAIDTRPLVEHSAATADVTYYPVFVAYGIKSVFPKFDIATMLKPTGLDAYPRLTTDGCWPLAHALFATVAPGTVVRDEWVNDSSVQTLFAQNQVGQKPIRGPLFIASGDVDTAVPADIVATRVKELCKLEANVEYRTYRGDHATMMTSSFQDQMRWIAERFKGTPVQTQCP
jgi:pimeloyl-ACP methyl ester carboxylesterase